MTMHVMTSEFTIDSIVLECTSHASRIYYALTVATAMQHVPRRTRQNAYTVSCIFARKQNGRFSVCWWCVTILGAGVCVCVCVCACV